MYKDENDVLLEENPFLKLNKSNFKSKEAKKNIKKTPTKIINNNSDDESSEFLNAMQHAKNFKQVDKFKNDATSTGAKTKNKAVNNNPNIKNESKAQDTNEDGFFEFANLMKDIKPLADEKSPKPEAKKKKNKTNSEAQDKNEFLNAMHKSDAKEINDDEGLAEFSEFAQGIKPLSGKEIIPPPKKEIAHNPALLPTNSQVEFVVNNSADYTEGYTLGLDLLIVSKLQRGQYKHEAFLDLHGLTVSQAYANLVIFMRNAHHRSYKSLLIVTGKGLNSATNSSILRYKLQEWLIKEPFNHLVLAFCSALPKDGGNGALYLLLRSKKKNKHQIDWNCQVVDDE